MNFDFNKVFEGWVSFLTRQSWLIIFLFFTLFLGSIYVAGTRLGINTDLSDMISDRLDFHKRWKEYRAEFPYLNETFLVVVDGETRRESSELVRQLRQELEKYPDLFLRVFELNGGEFFETYGVLFEEKASLEKLREHAPLAQRLSIKPDPAGFLSLMSHIPLERETKSLWESFSGSLAAAARNELLEMSFLERGDDSRLFLEIYPRLEYDQILPVERAFLKMREIFKEIDPNAKRLKLTGVAALAYEELQSVSEGAVFAGLLSLFLVAIILFWCLRSGRIIFICLSGLLVGLAITAAFAALAIGHLNLISVAFAVLFIGLGIDYSIHLSLRFLQLRENYVPEQAVSLALRDLWKSLLVCTLTTSVGFLAFVPTAYAGVSELGLISGFGMLVNFLIHISFFPAMLLKFGPRNPALIEMQRSFGALLADFCRRRSSLVRGVAGFLILLAIPFAWRVDFDPSPLNLQNPTTEAFRVYQGLLSEANRSPWTIKILVENREQGRDLVQKMSASEAVAEVVWLETFVPRQQKEKREILSSFKTRKPSKSKEASVLDWRTALVSLGETLKEQNLTQESLIELRSEILKTIDKMVAEASFGDRRLSTQLVKNFVEPVLLEWELMAQISDLPDLETDQLPPEIADRYRSPNGLYRVEVFPAKPMTDISAMREFASEILSITPKATDDPVTLPASGDAVVQAFWQASLTAFVLIFMLIFIIFRDLRAAFMVLFPLAFSGLIIKSAMTFLGLSFNFANIIVLPLLLGIGVDSGIHLLHRLRSSAPQEALLGNTARGVFFSALTTIASFGTLSISDHRGTASMGLLLTIGTLVVMLSTLSLIPALVRKQKVS